MQKTLLFGLIACSLLWPQLGATQDVELPKHIIPSSAVAAVFAQPKALLHSEAMELAPREVITVMGLQQFGFDPCEITNAMFLVDSFSDLQDPPGFALVITFGKPQQPGEPLTANFNKENLDGKTIYRIAPQVPAILQYDASTLVFGMEPFIQKMLSAKNAESPLIDLVNRDKGDSHLSAFVTMAPMRGTINQMLPPANQLPPPLNRLLELPNLIDSLSVHVDYSDQQQASLQITAVNESAGQQIEDIFDTSIKTGRQMLLATMAGELRDQNPAMQQAMEQYLERVGNYIEANIRPKRTGKVVLFEAKNGNGQLSSIAMMGTMMGMLLPAVQQAREAARRVESANLLRNMAIASHNYADAYGHFPTNIVDADGKPLLSWRVAILPFIEEINLYDQFHLDEPWDSEHNIKLLPLMPKYYQSTMAPSDEKTVFLGFSGDGTPFGKPKIKFRDIKDGTSNTILAVEANADEAIEWSRPKDLSFDVNQDVTSVGKLRPNGFNAVFCDGSVHLLPGTISQETLKNLIRMSDGNVVRLPDN